MDHHLRRPLTNPIPAADFNPPERIVEQIISDLHCRDVTMSDIAYAANTSLESLVLWMTRPEISARLDSMEKAISRRCRTQIANFTDGILQSCANIIEVSANTTTRWHVQSTDYRAQAIICKNASNALLAKRIVLHLLRYHDAHAQDAPPTQAHARKAPSSYGPNPLPNPSPSDSEDTNVLRPLSHSELLPRMIDSDILTISPLTLTNPNEPATPNRTRPTTDNTATVSPAVHVSPEVHVPPEVAAGGPTQQPVRQPHASATTNNAHMHDPFVHDTPTNALSGRNPALAPNPDLSAPTSSPHVTTPELTEATEPAAEKPCSSCTSSVCRCLTKSDLEHLNSDLSDLTPGIDHRAREPTLIPA